METEPSGRDFQPVALRATPRPSHQAAASPAQRLLDEILESSLILAEDWQGLADPVVQNLREIIDQKLLVDELVQLNLLTRYQAIRLGAGKNFGLILGNYRVLDRLASGGMGIIYKAEHIRMRRLVAIKVLPVPRDQHTRMLMRFFAEMRAIAQLQHPNIVAAMD